MKNLKRMLVSIPVIILTFLLSSAFAYAAASKSGVVTGDTVNVRQTPSTSATILTQLPKGAKVDVLDASEGWYKVSDKTTTGWVSDQFLTVSENPIGTGTIQASDVNVRSTPDTASEVVTQLAKGTKVNCYELSGDWYRIQLQDKRSGWIRKDFITVGAVEALPAVKEEAKEETNTQRIIVYAKKFLGVRYRYGSSSPTKGFDCSGFVQYVFKRYGITLERTSSDQAAHGTKVSKDALKAGDLVFFDTNGGKNAVNHVGIYIGDGKFIHASSGSNKKVVISDLTEGFYKTSYMTARRYIK